MSVRDSRIEYVTVEHSYYGCMTGCCGWIAFAYDNEGNLLHQSEFDFFDGTTEQEAIDFANKHFPGARFNAEESDWYCTL